MIIGDPAADRLAATIDRSRVDAATRGGAGDFRAPLTALIVDDEPDQLALLGTHLRRAGCTVIAMTDAEQALELPSSTHLDLIVLDLRLPGMSGWQLAPALRARHPGCPIAITSVLDVDDYPDADGVLPKPVSRAQVHALLAGLTKAAGHGP